MYKISEMDNELFAKIGSKHLSLYVGSTQNGRRYTYKTLGIATEIDKRTIRDYATGKTHISVVNLGRITQVLGIEFYNLVIGDFLGFSDATVVNGDKADIHEVHKKVSHLNTSLVDVAGCINHLNWNTLKPQLSSVATTCHAVIAMYDDKYD